MFHGTTSDLTGAVLPADVSGAPSVHGARFGESSAYAHVTAATGGKGAIPDGETFFPGPRNTASGEEHIHEHEADMHAQHKGGLFPWRNITGTAFQTDAEADNAKSSMWDHSLKWARA